MLSKFRRAFSSAAASARPELVIAQEAFFRNPRDSSAALQYFKLLNRGGQYASVVRFYRENSSHYQSYNSLVNEYNFASDNVIAQGAFGSVSMRKLVFKLRASQP